jgi:putative endonuclease
MDYFVYILYSSILDVYYKGFTTNLEQRIASHLEGKSKFTSQAKDWNLVYSKSFETKKEALIEEKRLKKLNRISLDKIIVG